MADLNKKFIIPEDYRVEHLDLPAVVLRDAISADSHDKDGNLTQSKRRIRTESALRMLAVVYYLARKKEEKDPSGYIDSVSLSCLQQRCRFKSKATVIAALEHLQERNYVTWTMDAAPIVSDIISEQCNERTVTIRVPFYGQMYQKNYGGYRKLPKAWLDYLLSLPNPAQMRLLLLATLNSFSTGKDQNNCSFEEQVTIIRHHVFFTARRCHVLQALNDLRDIIHFATRNLLFSFRLDNQYSYLHLVEATKERIFRELADFESDYDKATAGEAIDWTNNKYHSLLASIRSLPDSFFFGGFGPDYVPGTKSGTPWHLFDESSKNELADMTIHFGWDKVVNGLLKFVQTYAPKVSNGEFFCKGRQDFFRILNKIMATSET